MKFSKNDRARRSSLELGDLALLLYDDDLTDSDRERIWKAFNAIGSLMPVGGATTLITTETIRDMIPNLIWLWPADGGNVRTYALTSPGLESALGEAASGDKVVIPQDITSERSITIPANVQVLGLSRKHVTLTVVGSGSGAMLTMGDSSILADISLSSSAVDYTSMIATAPDAALENVRIDYNLDDSDFHHVLDNPVSGDFYLRECEIYATQASTGTLAIVRIESNTGDVIGYESGLSCVSAGQGYVAHKFSSSADGYIRLYGGWLRASYLATNF